MEDFHPQQQLQQRKQPAALTNQTTVNDDDGCSHRGLKWFATEYDTRPSRASAESKVLYNPVTGQLVQSRKATMGGTLRSWCQSSVVVAELYSIFLPAGYPASVSEEYLCFQCWDTVQAMCSYLRGVLATQSVLETVGVGSTASTPLAAALHWVFRDGAGMLGGLLFTYSVGPRFDANVKFWRLYADLINDVGLTLDMLAPLCPPSASAHLLTLSSVCKATCGVAAGATRSSLTAHFAKCDNMADVAAKESAQETAVTLFGLSVGMYFATITNSSNNVVWLSFVCLTLVHVLANYKAVKCLRLPTLNQQRASLLITAYGNGGPMSVAQINEQERIFSAGSSSVVMGARLTHMVDSIALYDQERYALSFSATETGTRKVWVHFKPSADQKDELRAFFNATRLMASRLDEVAAYQYTRTHFESFHQAVEANGWQTNRYLLECHPWRYDFVLPGVA